MKKRPIAIVTGGAGFIGSHTVDRLLRENYIVRVIDNLVSGRESNLEKHKTDPRLLCEWRDVCKLNKNNALFKGAKYVFHFAGIGDLIPSIENPEKYMMNNVQGTVKVLECSRENKIKKFVYAASSSCYGLAKIPTKENHPIKPEYPYALSKYLGEESAFHWKKIYDLPVNSIRIFNAYGTRVRTTGAYGAVFGVFLKQKLAGKPFTVVGNGKQKRDFVYVSDVANAFLLAAKTKLVGKIWNLGSGKPQSVNKLIEILKGDVVYIPKRPGEPECTYADITKIKKDLAWKPKIKFKKGVELMLKEIESWRDAPLWDAKKIQKATQSWFKYLKK
ncbi:MAG: NAD-dependent epimerase/dehydratase family protein [Pseudomonadota bacterium]|nr:NAD-dependent epimerase/dehydratase family protein [Pseudomonadota bacterium]MEE3260513.1 NAD-dependent epimerase/dehydratase family protein [Pseudomonadota bacterium]